MPSIAFPPAPGQPKVDPDPAPGGRSPLPCLNSNNTDEHPVQELPELSPYHQKSVFALGDNVERFCSLYGIENCGFLTLTFPDSVQDHKEAYRRFDNMNRRYLRTFYGEWINAKERMPISGAWHYHLVVQCKGDIRTGFDWEVFKSWLEEFSQGKRRRLRTGNPLLRTLWEMNREALPRYGFGRASLCPLRSTSEAVGKYIGKYISKQAGHRAEEDKGVRFTSYSKGFTASVPRFSWNTEGAKQWRRNLALFAIHACCCSTHEEFLERAPRRWAYRFRKDIMSYHRHYAERYPEGAPF